MLELHANSSSPEGARGPSGQHVTLAHRDNSNPLLVISGAEGLLFNPNNHSSEVGR